MPKYRIPVHEIRSVPRWYEIEAETKEEAISLAETGDSDSEEDCSESYDVQDRIVDLSREIKVLP